ncbi:MAG: hypothetical protein NTV11_16105 [Rhodocyclales bacterium]|nr:hypothetical protein [Rhodocyclales bacterium]
MKLFGTTRSFWLIRAPLAVVGGVVIGQIAQVPLALLLDLVWQNDVTGGRWPFTLPNVLLACMVGLLAGFSTGWIAGRRGKLLGAIGIFLPLWLLLTVTVMKNVDPTEYFEQIYDTRPALWVWIALVPGIVGGHFGALDGKRYFNRAAFFCGVGFLWLAGIGFSLFHLYTGFIAFEIAGFMVAIITLGFPFVAELYWVWRIWNDSGHFLNHYTSLILMLVIFLIVAGVGGIAFEKTKKWIESKDVT